MRIKKSANGTLHQNCDVYIGKAVKNVNWNLITSEWNNHFFRGTTPKQITAACVKYEKYLREERPDLMQRLGELEGKVLGCWCKPGACHGDVLVKLVMEYRHNKTQRDIERCGFTTENSTDAHAISEARQWADRGLWLTHATRLDTTDVFYFTPNAFFALEQCLGYAPDYWTLTSDDMVIFAVGTFRGTQPLFPLWHDDLRIPQRVRNPDNVTLQFARMAHFESKAEPEEWELAVKTSKSYLIEHRAMVRECGRLLGVNMENHDLTKTRIVQIALGYVWHFEGVHTKLLVDAAKSTITMGHCEREDHHPEWELTNPGRKVNTYKLLVDRLAVHLQKDDFDDHMGWDVNLKFVPERFRKAWNDLRTDYGRINLYENVYHPIKAALFPIRDINW